jgi:2-dehydropantoate 2-reductase
MGENRARFEVPQVCELIDAMFAECMQVARAQGIEPAFDPMLLVRKIRAGEIPLTRHAGSMASDLAAGRETELEALTGYMVRSAHALGVQVPVTETVYRLAKGVEYAALLRTAAPR